MKLTESWHLSTLPATAMVQSKIWSNESLFTIMRGFRSSEQDVGFQFFYMMTEFLWSCDKKCCLIKQRNTTGWLEEFSRSLSHQNYTFYTQKMLLVTLRHPRSLGFQLCIPIFHIHLCTVGQFVFPRQKIWNCPQGQTIANKNFIFIKINPE